MIGRGPLPNCWLGCRDARIGCQNRHYTSRHGNYTAWQCSVINRTWLHYTTDTSLNDTMLQDIDAALKPASLHTLHFIYIAISNIFTFTSQPFSGALSFPSSQSRHAKRQCFITQTRFGPKHLAHFFFVKTDKLVFATKSMKYNLEGGWGWSDLKKSYTYL